jgi:hypothetical protein
MKQLQQRMAELEAIIRPANQPTNIIRVVISIAQKLT